MQRNPINSHHGLVSKTAPRGLLDALKEYAKGVKVEAEYNFFVTATTMPASEQTQLLMHNGRHSWLEKLEAKLFNRNDPDGFWKKTEVWVDGIVGGTLDNAATKASVASVGWVPTHLLFNNPPINHPKE